MGKTPRKTTAKTAPKRKPAGKNTSRDECPTPENKEATERFIRDIITRGEAAKPDQHDQLPPGATHEIVEEREGELPKIERKRFSIF